MPIVAFWSNQGYSVKMGEFQKDVPEGYFPSDTSDTKNKNETYEVNGLHFVWDKAKNETNVVKHGIDFKTAALVFNDDYCLIDEDYGHSEGEDRESITGQEIGTDENPIMIDGIPYVYSSTGKLVRRLDFDPETMEIFVLPPNNTLTEEQVQMLKKANSKPIAYDFDCPKSTPEQLERFRRYGIARNQRLLAERAVQ